MTEGGRAQDTRGAMGPFWRASRPHLGMVSNILTGHASIGAQTGKGEGSFVETQHPVSLVVLFMSIGRALPRTSPPPTAHPHPQLTE